MRSHRMPLRAAALILGAVLLAGCQQDLYSNLVETEANQMLAILMSNGIPSEKVARGKEGFAITVEGRDMLRAIAVLKDAGYPRSSRDSIGKVFQKSGIMSSPFEERVRYIYALGEDVAQTLSNIDGVVTARVHIVLPDAPQLGQPVKPSSAAVFIKHQPGVDLDFFVPQIRRLVSSSIEGLEYSAVTVVLADAQPTKVTAQAETSGVVEVLPGLAIRESDTTRFWQIAGAAAAVIGLLLISTVTAVLMLARRSRGRGAAADKAVALVEPT
ncbi:type III secretion system inner membrane ring lipoprotein SctJ [Prosthecomicrobium sp. N25]|uniref:type III secretion system inner membrane ring lipoprotein SctJ n=1 Tax=Prosthecomicrobium sp. N25 TaxID=3129254 RepID=UPI003076E052